MVISALLAICLIALSSYAIYLYQHCREMEQELEQQDRKILELKLQVEMNEKLIAGAENAAERADQERRNAIAFHTQSRF